VTPAGLRRITAAGALVAAVAAGLAVHALLPDSAATDIAGDALYAVAIYAGLVVLLGRKRSVLVAALATSWCIAVELLQLTSVPFALAEEFAPLALVFGTGFDVRDLIVYVAAVAVVFALDSAARRRRNGMSTTQAELEPV
jgi:hypothetical protein